MADSLPTPFDARLMNFTASVLFFAFAALLLAAAGWWALRNPVFALGGITVVGDVSHNNALTLRANVAPKISGNFFTVNLTAARQAFQEVPWVRQAVVRREFPNRLRVLLQEHQAVAFWGDENESKLVNTFGEVFEANLGDVEQDGLPRLLGPQGQSAHVLAMHRVLKPVFEPLDLSVEQLALNGRGSWQVGLDTGAEIELGGGTVDEVIVRTRSFVSTLTQVTAKYGRRPDDVVSADLRHSDGYAIRLRGVSTIGADAQKK